MPVEVKFNNFKDISLSFKRHPVTNDILSINGEDAIKRSVINLVRTKVGERFFASILGTDVESSLFDLDNSSLETQINNQIKDVIENFEPRVSLDNILVSIDNNELNVKIQYNIIGLNFNSQQIDLLLYSST